MVENRPFLDFLAHLVLIIGVAIVAFPVWIALVASTHEPTTFLSGVVPLWFGSNLTESYTTMLSAGMSTSGAPPVAGCCSTAW
jgi:sn-glycerol 3-phosphate transport system permease protein